MIIVHDNTYTVHRNEISVSVKLTLPYITLIAQVTYDSYIRFRNSPVLKIAVVTENISNNEHNY